MSKTEQIQKIFRAAPYIRVHLSPETKVAAGVGRLQAWTGSGDILLDVTQSWVLADALHVGQEVFLRMPFDDDMWEVQSRVADIDGTQRQIRLSEPHSLKRIQRRENFRIAVEMPAQIYLDGRARIDTQTRDLSAGGVRVNTPQRLDEGTELRLCLSMPTGENFDLEGTIRSCGHAEESFWAGIEFKSVPSQVEQKINRFIMRLERERSASDPD